MKKKPNYKEIIDNAWLGIDDLEDYVFEDNLKPMPGDENYYGIYPIRLMQNPDYVAYAAKTLLNMDMLPEQAVILSEFDKHSFPMFIGSRGYGKTTMLATYAMLKMALTPSPKSGGAGCKIIVVGSAFRQSKFIFDYMNTIWENAPRLRSICRKSGAGSSGPYKEVDKMTMRIGPNWASAIPIGSGEKIRGLRATITLVDEFACLSKDSLVETKHGLVRIQNKLDAKNKIYTGDSDLLFEKPSKYITTPPTNVYKIKMSNGYIIKCSKIHKVMTHKGWKTPKQLCVGDYIESENKYKFPKRATIDKKIAWLLGYLLAEGSITDSRLINITTTDLEIANKLIDIYGFKMNTKNAYIDNRGWNCKKSYCLHLSNKEFRKYLYSLGLDYNKAIGKKIPDEILKQPREIVLEFLAGLFEGDGSCFLYKDKKNIKSIGLAYYSVSETLCRDVQILLDKLGYDSYINNRDSNISNNKQWFIRLNGKQAYDFGKTLNISRFRDAINNCILPEENTYISYSKNENRWHVSKTYLGKVIQRYFKNYNDAVKFRDNLLLLPRYRKVISIELLKEKEVLYDYYLPRTHSFYACGSRQHNSIPLSIYETVIQGFGSVASDPIEVVKRAAANKKMVDLGLVNSVDDFINTTRKNKIILSGTASYDFEHFADYWRKYKAIIESRGDLDKLKLVFNGEIPNGFNWKDFCVIRVPHELIPSGFLSDEIIARAKATVHSGTFAKEYGAVFTKDSMGFFKRSLIESCVSSEIHVNDPHWPSWCPDVFDAVTRGKPDKKYVIAVDPASELDNFSIVILELHEEHARVVYCWTTNRKKFRENKKAKLTKEDDFYAFGARKIRDLMKVFPCEHIAVDAQGGGIALIEALHDKRNLLPGEVPFWPIIDPDKSADTDGESGPHIIHQIQFSKYDWVSEANHGMKKDMEDKILLFPRFDLISVDIAEAQDLARIREFEDLEEGHTLVLADTLEDCILEIEELKDELTSIIVTKAGTGIGGRDRWDTPETKTAEGKKGRMKKDRYSALLMANMVARQIRAAKGALEYGFGGLVVDKDSLEFTKEDMIISAPDWYRQTMEQILGY